MFKFIGWAKHATWKKLTSTKAILFYAVCTFLVTTAVPGNDSLVAGIAGAVIGICGYKLWKERAARRNGNF